jgi:hypothetical protein
MSLSTSAPLCIALIDCSFACLPLFGTSQYPDTILRLPAVQYVHFPPSLCWAVGVSYFALCYILIEQCDLPRLILINRFLAARNNAHKIIMRQLWIMLSCRHCSNSYFDLLKESCIKAIPTLDVVQRIISFAAYVGADYLVLIVHKH